MASHGLLDEDRGEKQRARLVVWERCRTKEGKMQDKGGQARKPSGRGLVGLRTGTKTALHYLALLG